MGDFDGVGPGKGAQATGVGFESEPLRPDVALTGLAVVDLNIACGGDGDEGRDEDVGEGDHSGY